MFRTAASLALLGLLASSSSASAATASEDRSKQLGKGFVLAKPGQLCPAVCAGAGQKPATFAHLTTETAVCAGYVGGAEGWVPGWSYVTFEGAPPPKAGCNVAANKTTPFEASEEYACLCMKGQIQGIDLPKGKPCSKACSKSITGRPGHSVAGNAGEGKNVGSACVSLPIELGELNRFGHVHEGDDKCRTNIGDAVVDTDSFTCFCLFDAPAGGAGDVEKVTGVSVGGTEKKKEMSAAAAPAPAPAKSN